MMVFERRVRNHRGFTLIEAVVVLVIIGIIGGVMIAPLRLMIDMKIWDRMRNELVDSSRHAFDVVTKNLRNVRGPFSGVFVPGVDLLATDNTYTFVKKTGAYRCGGPAGTVCTSACGTVPCKWETAEPGLTGIRFDDTNKMLQVMHNGVWSNIPSYVDDACFVYYTVDEDGPMGADGDTELDPLNECEVGVASGRESVDANEYHKIRTIRIVACFKIPEASWPFTGKGGDRYCLSTEVSPENLNYSMSY